VNIDGVSVIGPVNVAASLPFHASQMFGRNIEALVRHLFRDGQVVVSPTDEITGPMTVTHAGEISSR
jgi:NAD(P) transhydrogenase subunit alpha